MNLYAIGREKILCHALDQDLKKEPDVLEELADNELVSLVGPQCRL